GDMGELGAATAAEHSKIISLLEECGFSDVWLVGHAFADTDSRYRKFADVDEVKCEIEHCRPTGKCILVKGSNSTRLYQLPELL
ncbi:MAG: UDP-N-acetylmuramoyl-tripeptide--D-alanyl-D-alanine ligase, partial [Prevotella sp.]